MSSKFQPQYNATPPITISFAISNIRRVCVREYRCRLGHSGFTTKPQYRVQIKIIMWTKEQRWNGVSMHMYGADGSRAIKFSAGSRRSPIEDRSCQTRGEWIQSLGQLKREIRRRDCARTIVTTRDEPDRRRGAFEKKECVFCYVNNESVITLQSV